MLHRPAAVVSMMLVLWWGSGCTEPEGGISRSPGEFSSRRVQGVSLAEAEAVAGRVFRNHFRLDLSASSSSRLVSLPAEVQGRGQDTALMDRVRLTPARQRELAELRIEPQQDGVLVQVNVTSQRLETTERAAFARERGDDRPNQTAIDRTGPTSVDQREEWRTIGRNRRLEQAIINEIVAGLAQGTRPAEGT